MKKVLLTLCAALTLPVFFMKAAPSTPVERPKLVIGLVVDQMRWDYLYRYYELFGEGGFKRLLNEGFNCENTQLNYVPTVTSIGHTCIYTGSVLAIHGIAGNEFIFRNTGKQIYCTSDTTVQSIGCDNASGKMSPRNLLVTTVSDELHLATNFRSKVISVSLKDRAAILPGGHTADAAYWFDSKTGRWITSSYYMNELPAWVDAFNRTDPARRLLEQEWNTLYPIDRYVHSTPDDTPYEKPFEKDGKPIFPIQTSKLLKTEGYGIIRNTPYGNTMTLQMAKQAIEHEAMGQDKETDMLTVSLSSTDYIGHQFGPNAIETEDTYLRLDKDLSDFLNYVDQQVGVGNYILFLTADHAAAHNTRFLTDHDIPAGIWDVNALENSLDSLIAAKFHVEDAIQAILNYQVFLNHNKLRTKGNDLINQVKQTIIDYLQAHNEVMFAVNLQQAGTAPLPAPVRERVINGFNHSRSGDIQIVLNPGWYEGEIHGTTHGVWCPYDAHVPLIFMGWNIPHGQTLRPIHLTDIAATVASLLHIQAPNGCIGTPITEVLK